MVETFAAAGNATGTFVDTSNASTLLFFRKILRTGRNALRQFSAWRKAELLAIGTMKSIRVGQRYHRLTLPPPTTAAPQATQPTPSIASIFTPSHDIQEEVHVHTSSLLTQRSFRNTSPPTPAAFVKPTCSSGPPSTFPAVASAHLFQTTGSPAVGSQAALLASPSDRPYETHLMLASGLAIGIFLFLRFALPAVQCPPLEQDRVDVVPKEERNVDRYRGQRIRVGDQSPNGTWEEQRGDTIYGALGEPLTQYTVPRPISAVLITERPHYVVLEAEEGSPLLSESGGTTCNSLADRAFMEETSSDASGSPVDSPVFSLPSAYSQDSMGMGEDTTVITRDDVPRPLELPQDRMMRGLVLGTAAMLSTLWDDPPSPLPNASCASLSKTSFDTKSGTVRAMLYNPKDCDMVLTYLRRQHARRSLDSSEDLSTEDDRRELAEYKGALARIRRRREELDPADEDVTVERDRPDMSAVRHMSFRFQESVAAGIAPYGKGTKEEIWEWLTDEENERHISQRSARRTDLYVGPKPDLGEIVHMHSSLTGFVNLLSPDVDSFQHLRDISDEGSLEETRDTAKEAETHPVEWATDKIMIPGDEMNLRVERGGPAIRNSRRPARGGKVRAPARHSYVPWDGRTTVFLELHDLPNLGDVTTVVHDGMRGDVAYEMEFRHAPHLLEKIEVDRRQAVARARAMRYASTLDERGRPLARTSKMRATILDEAPEDASDADTSDHLYTPSTLKLEEEAVEVRRREGLFARNRLRASGENGSQAQATSPPPQMEAEEVEELKMLAMLRASRPKRR